MDTNQAISMLPVLRAASPASRASLLSCSVLRRFEKGEHLFLDRDEARHVYFLAERIAALYKIGNKHEKKVIFIYGAGAMLNETVMDEKYASINCELLSDANVLHIRSLTERGLAVVDRNRFMIPDRDKLKKYYDEV